MNKSILIILAVILVGGAAYAFVRVNNEGKNAGVFCGSDNQLVDKKPIQSHRSYCMVEYGGDADTGIAPAGYAFEIIDDQGNTLKDFAISHEKMMHFIAVRKDLNNFQHLHPTFDAATGVFTVSDLKFPTDGEYRLFADFVPGKSINPMQLSVVAYADKKVGTTYAPQPIGGTENIKTFGTYRITLDTMPRPLMPGEDSMLHFTITANDKPVKNLEQYLGALGHSVILSQGDLQFIHAHPSDDPAKPQTGKVDFMVNFPEAGTYKAFTQFQINGKVITTDFVIKVAAGSAPASGGGTMMQGMDHSMH